MVVVAMVVVEPTRHHCLWRRLIHVNGEQERPRSPVQAGICRLGEGYSSAHGASGAQQSAHLPLN
ncbi:hypothetical protein SLEP1_g17935 [Rubroshorea leprosula]|uniref:Uncharacterized protein n=1 Tax=Rubroshorea leprosula TaxID=152421 RepID=A0AAV5J522_9ROSI|nr:hypothetical protein SLEP1_g17935 [Rubroshorea leprosula]